MKSKIHMNNHKKQYAATSKNLKSGVSIALFAVTGAFLLLLTRAAGNFLSIEPETGNLTGASSVINDVSASGGKAIKFGSQAPQTGCNVAGGTSTSPTNLGAAIGNTGCTVFNLADGYYTSANITRAGITIRAANACKAIGRAETSVNAYNVTIDGMSFTGNNTPITVSRAGAKILNNCISGFGKTGYANAIWVYKSALDPANKVIVDGNKLDNWGGAQYAGGIAVGNSSDNRSSPTSISVEIKNNRITNGPTAGGIYNAAIQSFFPVLVYKNFVDRNSHAAFQNKSAGSRCACNEFSNITQDGPLYNRVDSNNIWEYNIVHDSSVAIDHFAGNNDVFRGNILYNNNYAGRVKDQEGIGSTNLTFENNTIYGSGGFFWDHSTGGPLSNIIWKNNIFMNISGDSIRNEVTNAWDEFGNVFYNAAKPTGTTGSSNGTSFTANPNFVSPLTNWTVQNTAVQGKGAPWPLPCP
jgi:hypothetical protein